MNMISKTTFTGVLYALAGPFVVSLGIQGAAFASESPEEKSIVEYSVDAIEHRFHEMSLPFEATTDAVFHRRVRAYMLDGRNYSDRMLLRIAMYFPYIEKQLEKRDLPRELKYLTVTESAVNPSARSRAGAVGLWQIMIGTARQLGLRVGRVVDERMDPKRSTEAALDYLEELYNRYDDWKLALAAYNCGPGRVDQAIRRSGSRDFDVLMRFLPYETRQYIPSFMAATYFGTYHADHGIVSQSEDYDLVLTGTVKIHETINFTQLSEKTGVSRDILVKLNPAFRSGYIPANSRGYDVIMPLWAANAYKQARDSEIKASGFKRVFNGYVESVFLTEREMDWKDLSEYLHLDPHHIKYLNLHLGSKNIIPEGSEIRFVVPRFSGFYVKGIGEDELIFEMNSVNPLPAIRPGLVKPVHNSGLPGSSSKFLAGRDAQVSGTRIRKIYSNRNVPGRGQSLSDAERMENFHLNRTQKWKAAFAAE